MRTHTRARPFARMRCVCSVLAGFFGLFDSAVVNKFNCTFPGEPASHSLFAIYFVTVKPKPEIEISHLFSKIKFGPSYFLQTKCLVCPEAGLSIKSLFLVVNSLFSCDHKKKFRSFCYLHRVMEWELLFKTGTSKPSSRIQRT